MKKTVIIIGAAFLVLMSLLLYGAKPNFSGNWIIDKKKSDVGEKKLSELSLSIKHKGKHLNITEITKKDKNESKRIYKYITDGKENVQTTKKGIRITSKAKLSSDGKIVTINRTRVSTKGEKEKKESVTIKMHLSEDGKTLTVETTQVAPQKKSPVKQIFHKSKEKEKQKEQDKKKKKK